MRLIFDDEFNGTSLDSTKWNALSGHPWGVPAYFTPQDVRVGNGNLDLLTEQRSSNGYPYTTGMVTTQGKFSFLYGRVDIRAKMSSGQGMWPALWMLSNDGAYETDNMEMLGNAPGTVYMTVHDWATGNQYTQGQYIGADFSADYHIFSLVWQPGQITWYVDGVQRYQTTRYVSNAAMYLLLDNWVGDSNSWPGAPNSSTVFPQHMSVDYVRIYQ